MKRNIALLLVALLTAALLPLNACAEGVVLEYPEGMRALGYTEPVRLEAMPVRVVSMATSPVLALNALGVNLVAIPSSGVVEWPEDLLMHARLLQAGMNSAFDIETVIALEPDLVLMPYASRETYGIVLESVNIPVYYVDAGHTVAYESVKAQTQALIDAFAPGSEAGARMMRRFDELEARLDELQSRFAGKTCMVLQSAPPSHYIQTADGTLGSMARMLGFINVYENNASAMVQIDYEQLLSYDPDVILAVGSSTKAEEHEALLRADFEKNPEYWYSIRAVAEGDLICLPVTYVSSAGINIVDNINALADLIEAHYAD